MTAIGYDALLKTLFVVESLPAWFGRLIESYVVSQLRAELALCRFPPRLFHLREKNGRHEIDLLAEFPDGNVIAMEIKAHAAPTRAMAAHLLWLQEQIGDRFLNGILFHTGPHPFTIAEGIHALPICTIWG